jgi:hypothetical protein
MENCKKFGISFFRSVARELARQEIAAALQPLFAYPAPEYLTSEQAGAFTCELRRISQRAIGK